MCFKKTSLFILICIFIGSNLIAQKEKTKIKNKLPIVYEVTEENYQFFLKKNPFVLIYFYSKSNSNSLKMKKILPFLKISQKPALLAVCIDTNLGLRRTFKIPELPSLILLKKRKVIYGLTGMVDDPKVLSNFINTGIKNNDFE